MRSARADGGGQYLATPHNLTSRGVSVQAVDVQMTVGVIAQFMTSTDDVAADLWIAFQPRADCEDGDVRTMVCEHCEQLSGNTGIPGAVEGERHLAARTRAVE